jgi:FkbM family methyltransferase
MKRKRIPDRLRPYARRAYGKLFPTKITRIDEMKFRYLRNDAPPHNPEEFSPGIEFHERIERIAGNLAIDVGANIGSYTLPLARRFEKVIAFEPSSVHCKLLRMNVAINGLRNISIYEVALSDVNDTVPLYIRRGGATSLNGSHYGLGFESVVSVKAARLDDFSSRFEGLDFVKLDAEGFELQILRGAEKLFSTQRPVIAVEVHKPPVPTKDYCGCNVCEYLRRISYRAEVTGEASSVGGVHWVWAAPIGLD